MKTFWNSEDPEDLRVWHQSKLTQHRYPAELKIALAEASLT